MCNAVDSARIEEKSVPASIFGSFGLLKTGLTPLCIQMSSISSQARRGDANEGILRGTGGSLFNR